MSRLAVLCLLLLQTGVHGFGISLFWSFGGASLKHEEITERAILNTTLQVCRRVALAEGKDFTFPPQPFTAESVVVACEASKSSKSFRRAINLIQCKNRRVDLFFFLFARYHLDNEEFTAGKKIITDGLAAVKASIKEGNFKIARQNLGKILHPLQDFYSHSNWVEMGNRVPNSNLIRPGTSIGNIAATNRATCRNCVGNDCRNNILEDILEEEILTSGYFGLIPFFSSKPPGKCSHGGWLDRTSNIEPTGGINKDTFDASHGHLHLEAANVAIAATSQLLEDVRGAAGDRPFLQLMGINKGSNKALCFVIDTTGSMSDDIAAVRSVTSSIIEEKVGTEEEPSLYILVPFNDPGFGPLIRTTDPEVFKNEINSLSATGGGDFPEMSLSGLRLALTGAPPNSEIFLFTDAPAKDTHLRSSVMALIEQTKTAVNFMITDRFGFRRRRQSENDQQQRHSRMSGSDSQLYRDLAQASGGQAVEVNERELLTATTIITDSSNSLQVTLLQAARSPGKAENFTFTVDESVRNFTIDFTGSSLTFTIISPTGVSLSSNNLTGSLVITSQSVGNFQTLQMKVEVGLWKVQMMSTSSYTVKVVADSSIDFLFDFLDVSQGPLGGFYVLENRPRAGVNGSLRVTVTGSDSATVTEVTLVESSGSGQVNGSVNPQGRGVFVVHFDRIPSVEFVVLIKGQSSNSSFKSSSSVPFQRQSPTTIRASSVTVTAAERAEDDILAPGVPVYIPFSVMSNSSGGGSLDIRVTNDEGFPSLFPSTLSLDSAGSANGTVTLTAPSGTPSGTDVTLTIEATDPGSGDTNYVLLLFTVLTTVTDFTPPVCQQPSLQSNCSTNCSDMWELSVQVNDGSEGMGIEHVSLRQGNGTMNSSLAPDNENITLVSYKASCCSPDVEMIVVDQVGNVGTCFFTVRENVTITTTSVTTTTTTTSATTTTTNITTSQPPTAAPAVSSSTKTAQSFLLCLSVMILGLSLPSKIGIN